MNRLNVSVLIFFGALALDMLSKQWVHASLSFIQWGKAFPYGGIALFEHFLGMSCALVHVTNKGIAWGLFPSLSFLFPGMRLCAGALLIWKAFQQPAHRLSFLLIAAGAFGNAIDAFRFGHVIDMILLNFGSYTYPVFNIADSAICIGVALLILNTVLKRFESASSH